MPDPEREQPAWLADLIDATREWTKDCGYRPTVGDFPYRDALLRIEAANRTVVYRIGDYRSQLNAWEATWPD
jgi:hypothetical protein